MLRTKVSIKNKNRINYLQVKNKNKKVENGIIKAKEKKEKKEKKGSKK